MITIGNNTSNQENIGAPASHIKFNIQVQNKIYKILIAINIHVLATLHSKYPMHNLFRFRYLISYY